MAKIVSITVTYQDETGEHTKQVDISKHCALFWNQEGWTMLADFYEHAKKDVKKAKDIRTRLQPTTMTAMKGSTEASKDLGIAIKKPECEITTWP
ncbi:MAG: hypothetical protein LWX11_11550 [Firmicutes bacterium]|nr:hypothetical protein [Bacillota bacterium]